MHETATTDCNCWFSLVLSVYVYFNNICRYILRDCVNIRYFFVLIIFSYSIPDLPNKNSNGPDSQFLPIWIWVAIGALSTITISISVVLAVIYRSVFQKVKFDTYRLIHNYVTALIQNGRILMFQTVLNLMYKMNKMLYSF